MFAITKLLQLIVCVRVSVCVVAGLLLCYELPVQTDRDGRPIDRFLISRSRSYQHTLAALIHEVHLDPFLPLPLMLLFGFEPFLTAPIKFLLVVI